MLCRDMAIEQELLEALAAVRSYEVQHHRLRLYDANGTARVVLLVVEE
jgi:heat shock protein HslJ